MRRRSVEAVIGLVIVFCLIGLLGCSSRTPSAGIVLLPDGTSAGTGAFPGAAISKMPTEVWKTNLPGTESDYARSSVNAFSLLASADRVFVGTSDGRIHALSLKTGKIVWSHGKASPDGERRMARIYGAADDLIYVGGDGQLFTALRAKTGRVAWESPAGGPAGSVTIWQDSLYGYSPYPGAADGKMTTWDPKTGERRWSASVPNPGTEGTYGLVPIIADGHICLITSDLRVQCLDAANGESQWSTEIPALFTGERVNGAIVAGSGVTRLSRPTIGQGAVYVVAHCIWPYGVENQAQVKYAPARLYALDLATGQIRWQCELPLQATRVEPPVVSESTVVVHGTKDVDPGRCPGLTAAVDINTGKIAWRSDDDMDFNVPGMLAIVGSTLYSTSWTTDSTLRAFDLTTGKLQWALNTSYHRGAFPIGDTCAIAPVDGGLVVALSDGTIRLLK